jgi:hypothetical protein
LSNQQFQTDKNVDASCSNSLYALDMDFFAKGFDSPFSHLHKCLNTDDYYYATVAPGSTLLVEHPL